VSVYVSVALQRRIRAHFENGCVYCRTPEDLSVAIFEFEHIIPLSAAGKTTYENLCLACPTCNRFKADRISADDSVTQQNVPLFHPWKDAWSDHFAWSDDAATMLGLTPIGRATIAALRMNRPTLIRVRRIWAAIGEHPRQFD
jgi:hypothetical protein